MNIKNIVNNVAFREYDKLKSFKEKLVVKAFKANLFANFNFIEHFEDWDEPYFWAQTICLSKIPIEDIIEKFKGNVINDNVYLIVQEFKHTYEEGPKEWALRNSVLKNIERYNNEYENYCKKYCKK